MSPRGGWGNELMLTDFRRVFGVPFTAAESERGWDSADDETGVVGGGNRVLEGARSPVLGVLVSDLVDVDGGWSPEALRVLATGSAGRAMDGGPLEGREGLGSAVVIFRTWKGYQAVAFWPRNDKSAVLIPPVLSQSRMCVMLCVMFVVSGKETPSAGKRVLLKGVTNTLAIDLSEDYPTAS